MNDNKRTNQLAYHTNAKQERHPTGARGPAIISRPHNAVLGLLIHRGQLLSAGAQDKDGTCTRLCELVTFRADMFSDQQCRSSMVLM